MDIYLHLGAHRSANRTFYRYLTANRSALQRNGFALWLPNRTQDGLMRGLVKAPEDITIEDERRALRSIGRMRVELARLERSGNRCLVISDPDLIGNVAHNLTQSSLYPLLDERLMRLRPAFADRNLRVGISIRSFDDYWASALAMRVALGQGLPCADQLDFLTTQTRHWRHVIRDIAKALPHAEIVVWPFERLAGRPHDTAKVLLDTDLAGAAVSNDWLRRSPDMAQLNEICVDCGLPPMVSQMRPQPRRWMPFTAEHQRVLRAEYRRDLAWLKAGAQGLARYIEGRHVRSYRPQNRGQIHLRSRPMSAGL